MQNPTGVIDADPVFAQFLKIAGSLEMKAKLIAEELSRNEHVVAVILFGSVARGEADEDSDIDPLVITRGDDKKFMIGRPGSGRL